MKDQLEALRLQISKEVKAAESLELLEELEIKYLGRKGQLTSMLKGLASVSAEERPVLGALANEVKQAGLDLLAKRRSELANSKFAALADAERADMTEPGNRPPEGHLHLVTQTIREITAIFERIGFYRTRYPEVDWDWYAFESLNMPPEHPARQEHDTFYLPDAGDGRRMVLRTHTSPVQIRTMLASPPPIRIIAPGRTYRCDSDATHSPMFHQVEGLVVDEATHMGHLKGCLIEFCRAFFGIDDLPVRFRPSFFPFTEPSAEVDIGCSRSGGTLRIGHGEGWLEILGSGMVNPRVLRSCGIDPDRYQGFAFGMGIERIAMLKYGIPDLRTFYESDLRWLRHYGFQALQVPSLVGGLDG